jgi:hypothetical protein
MNSPMVGCLYSTTIFKKYQVYLQQACYICTVAHGINENNQDRLLFYFYSYKNKTGRVLALPKPGPMRRNVALS